jgi:anaerobic selenocysteine-containing dehydrogenase
MPPPEEMRDPYEVLRSVARQLGETVAAALPWSGGKEAVDAVCRELFEAGKGAAFGSANEPGWAQLLESRGWRAPFAKNLSTFKRDVLAGGGWIDPIYFHREWDRVFRSPERKFAFSSLYLARSFEALPEPGQPPHADRRCLPDCTPQKAKHDQRFPFELHVYPLPNLFAVASANLPWLNDIAGAYMFEKWRTWVEINPEAAAEHGIADGDLVQVRTPRGRLTLPARIYRGIMPEVLVIPFGFGHRTGGRWCQGIGENPAEIVEARIDPLSGTALWSPTPASIEKV